MSMLKSRQVGSIAILTPKGHLMGGEGTEELERAIKKLAEDGNKHLLINLTEMQNVNSTARGVLISADWSYVRRGGQMKLAAVDKRIENIFVITKLSLVFDVYSTEERSEEHTSELQSHSH